MRGSGGQIVAPCNCFGRSEFFLQILSRRRLYVDRSVHFKSDFEEDKYDNVRAKRSGYCHCNSDITRHARNRRTSTKYMQKSFPCGHCSRMVGIAGSEQRCEDVGKSGENTRWAELGAIC